jgi:hypothetical protein
VPWALIAQTLGVAGIDVSAVDLRVFVSKITRDPDKYPQPKGSRRRKKIIRKPGSSRTGKPLVAKKQLGLFRNYYRSTQFAFAQRAQIEHVSRAPSMIVTDWSDAALTIANAGGNVIAERASTPACARAPTQAE